MIKEKTNRNLEYVFNNMLKMFIFWSGGAAKNDTTNRARIAEHRNNFVKIM